MKGQVGVKPVVLLSLFLFFPLFLFACSDDEDEGLPVRPVRVEAVRTGDVVERVELIGQLEGVEEVGLFAEMPERIRSLTVREGDRVKKDEVLAVLWEDVQTEAVNQAEGAFEAARANHAAAADHLRRTRALHESGMSAEAALQSAESQAQAAAAQMRQARAALAQAAVQRSRAAIRSPLDGVVADVSLREGDLAGAGVPIMTVLNPDRLKVALRAPEREFLRIEKGMPVSLAPLARPDRVVEAKVTLLSPAVNRATRTGLVEVHVNNEDGALVPGSAVRAHVELSRRPDAVLVPADAVLFDGETHRTRRAVVFVVEEDTAYRREVRIGVRQGSKLEIRQGLETGEQLVVEGAHFLRAENPVEILPPRRQVRETGERL